MFAQIPCLHCGIRLTLGAKRCPRCHKPPVSVLDYRFELRWCLRRDGRRLAFRGWDREERQSVFVRVLLPETDGAQEVEISMEASALQAVRGEPSFPLFIGGGRIHQTGGLYLVAEWVDGEPLCEILKRVKPGAAVDTLQRACRPLAALHRAGYIHGSVCLEHILLSRSGDLVLIDFRHTRPTGSNGYGTGRQGYRAPEQWRSGTPMTEATDVFALGACLYKALTRRFPYGSPNRRKLMRASYLPTPPSERRCTVAEDFDHVVLQALNREPAHRFPDMDALEQALTVEVGTTTQIDGFGYGVVSIPGRALRVLADAAGVLPDALFLVLRVGRPTLARFTRFVALNPRKAATAVALVVTGPALVLLRLIAATPVPTVHPSSPGPLDPGTLPEIHPSRVTALPFWEVGPASPGMVLPFMEPAVDPLAPPARPPTELVADAHCRVQFLTWPPAEVWFGGQYVVEAPSPTIFTFPAGSRKVRLVSKRRQTVEKSLAFSPGKDYVLKYNFDSNRLELGEQP